MIDINSELELSSSLYTPRDIHLDEDSGDILVTLYEGPYHIGRRHADPKTGVLRDFALGNENPLRLRPKSQTRPVDRFFMQVGEREWPKEHWVRIASMQFDTGKEAADQSKVHNDRAQATDSPFRFKVEKQVEMSKVLDYPSWMEYRFGTGEYAPVPWAGEPWVKAEHYAHLGLVDNCSIAFVESDYFGQQDQMTVMAPGRYLTKFYGDVLSPNEIRDWAVKVDVEAVLKFAHTADEIYEVYTAPNSPSSCMRYHDGATCHDGVVWKSEINPVRIYGAGDLAVAYMERKGKIIARALVWPAKKAVFRSYGDIERLKDALTADGWEFDASGNGMDSRGKGLFNGARLTLIRSEEYEGHIVMPYLDYGYSAQLDGDKLTMMIGGNVQGQTTCGIINTPGVSFYDEDEDDDDYDTICDRCEEGVNYDDTWTVNGDQNWCYSCREHHSRTCDYCHDRYGTLNDVHDANDGSCHAEACTNCVDDCDAIQQDHAGIWIDTSTAQCCDHCDTYFGNNSDETDCPNTNCAVHTAETEDA